MSFWKCGVMSGRKKVKQIRVSWVGKQTDYTYISVKRRKIKTFNIELSARQNLKTEALLTLTKNYSSGQHQDDITQRYK